MSQIAGKYQLVENKKFLKFLLDLGLQEVKAKEVNNTKGLVDVKVDGNKISVTNDAPPSVTNITLGQEFEENMPDGVILKSSATLNGNIVTVTSKTKDGNPAGSRVYKFTDSGLEVDVQLPKDGKTLTATRIYKRV